MTRRVWLTSNASGGFACRLEPAGPLGARVAVRAKDGTAPWDGVWLDGERSYDTYVIIDGVVTYHAPARSITGIDHCFELHEAVGGGHAP